MGSPPRHDWRSTIDGTRARLAFGGDYNPEQWPRRVWSDDIALMREAGVDLVTVGVFSWALLRPGPDRWEFEWLDDVLELLTDAGIGIDLATATASPPPWLTTRHPEMLPVTRDGTRLGPGSRQSYCPSSPVYREHALRLAGALAERYGQLPGLRLWHVNNEVGCHNAHCFCDVSAAAFRDWLAARYGDVEALNEAWGTSFWSQQYGDFAEILPPRATTAIANPTQELDFHRFSSDALLALFVAERDVLREHCPDIPVTTNLMITEHIRAMDYWRWAPELDLIANDHYLIAADVDAHRELAFCADLTRGLAGGRPWLLMETSPGAVNWQPRNVARPPGELLRSAFQHVGRGADGILFFQWRASRAGAEKYHAGIVPHAGTDSRGWREAVALRQSLDAVAEVAGSTVRNRVVMLFDWPSWWATELDARPSVDVTYLDRPRDLHRALTAAGVGVDVAPPGRDLTGYDLIVVPTLSLLSEADAELIRRAVETGATLLVTYLSGIADESDHVYLGGYPGALRDLLGVRVSEFLPLRAGERIRLDDGAEADVWAEDVGLDGAEAVLSFADGPAAGRPAVTRYAGAGGGMRWYVATRLDPAGTDALVRRVLADAAVPVADDLPVGVELTRREADDGRSWLFVINHGDSEAALPVTGWSLLDEAAVDDVLRVPAGGVAVLRQS